MSSCSLLWRHRKRHRQASSNAIHVCVAPKMSTASNGSPWVAAMTVAPADPVQEEATATTDCLGSRVSMADRWGPKRGTDHLLRGRRNQPGHLSSFCSDSEHMTRQSTGAALR